MELTVDLLVDACGDHAQAGGLLLEADLEPLAGAGSPVKPAIYAGNRYQLDRRWVGSGEERDIAEVLVIDNVPSQANRLEAALERLATRLGLPTIVLDLAATGPLPPHLPTQLSGFRFPHRQADAYLRDASLDGVSFPRTEVGQSLLAATADEPEALFQWFPQALLFGFWQSHLGRKGSQARLARSWVSEIVGVRPGAVGIRTEGIKGDPLNLSVDEKVVFDPDDPLDWTFAEGEKKAAGKTRSQEDPGKGKSQDSLSNIGHGQVPIPDERRALAAVSCEAISQRATVSVAGLRRVWCGSPQANAAGRALLVAIGLAAHVGAFGGPFSLRSGCDLRPRRQRWTWLGADGDEEVTPLVLEEACTLVLACAGRAEAAGLPVGSRWPAPLVLTPNAELTKVIRASYPAGE
jgi:CRISPR-associated protein Csb1